MPRDVISVPQRCDEVLGMANKTRLVHKAVPAWPLPGEPGATHQRRRAICTASSLSSPLCESPLDNVPMFAFPRVRELNIFGVGRSWAWELQRHPRYTSNLTNASVHFHWIRSMDQAELIAQGRVPPTLPGLLHIVVLEFQCLAATYGTVHAHEIPGRLADRQTRDKCTDSLRRVSERADVVLASYDMADHNVLDDAAALPGITFPATAVLPANNVERSGWRGVAPLGSLNRGLERNVDNPRDHLECTSTPPRATYLLSFRGACAHTGYAAGMANIGAPEPHTSASLASVRRCRSCIPPFGRYTFRH